MRLQLWRHLVFRQSMWVFDPGTFDSILRFLKQGKMLISKTLICSHGWIVNTRVECSFYKIWDMIFKLKTFLVLVASFHKGEFFYETRTSFSSKTPNSFDFRLSQKILSTSQLQRGLGCIVQSKFTGIVYYVE